MTLKLRELHIFFIGISARRGRASGNLGALEITMFRRVGMKIELRILYLILYDTEVGIHKMR